MLDRSRSRDRSKTGGAFSPAGLFVTGAQGAWYDPSDYSTLFQNSTGTTPVTAVEQPVRLMLDRSRQTSFPTRRNLVTTSQFLTTSGSGSTIIPSGSGWANFFNTGSRSVAASTVDPTTQAFTFSGTAQRSVIAFSFAASSSTTYTVSFWVEAISGTPGNVAYTDGTIGSGGTSGNVTNPSVGRVSYTFTTGTGAGTVDCRFGIGATGNATGSITISNPQIEIGSTLSAYQPTLALPVSWVGNHALAPNDASRPVLRSRYNQLTFSEQFDNGVWAKSDVTITANAAVAPDGTTTADKLVETATTNLHYTAEPTNRTGTFTYSIYAKAAERTSVAIAKASDSNAVRFNLSTGVITSTGVNWSNASIEALANGWYRCAATITLSSDWIYISPNNELPYTGDGTSGILIWGAQLLTAADQSATGGAYQRIAAATDYDTSNPVWRPYLAFDGSDDAMTIASSIHDVFQNVSGGTMWAGYNATSAIGATVVFASTNTGAGTSRAAVIADASGGRRLDADSFVSATDSGFAVNNTYVATNVSDWAGGNVIRRTNGVQVASTAYSSGAGSTSNTASLLVSLGANSSPLGNFLAGRLYSAIILGRAATTAELTATESWIAGKTGVVL